jgi:hypothetical protein
MSPRLCESDLTVRSEIGPYRRPVTALSRVAKNNRRRHPDEKFFFPQQVAPAKWGASEEHECSSLLTDGAFGE